jgi:AraC-like DNA-binding protein
MKEKIKRTDKSHSSVIVPCKRYRFHESDKPFYIGYREYQRRRLRCAKMHGGLEIGLQARGPGMFYFEDRFYPIAEGQLYIVDPMTPHGHETVGDELCGVLVTHLPTESIVHFSPENGDLQPLELFLYARRGVPLIMNANAAIRNALLKAHRLYNLSESAGKLLAWAEIVRVIALSLQKLPHSAGYAKEQRNRLMPIAEALNLLIRNPEKQWTIAELAYASNLSESRFSHLFSSIMQCSPLQYRNRLRIDRAVELLLSSDESVERIADLVGFKDASAFRSAFKKLIGKTPSQIKRA